MFRRASFKCCPNDGATLIENERDPLIGTVLADRYLIEAQIGEGGMGRVYRARHKRVGRQFAIKVLFGDVASHDNVVSRFEREAAAAGRLNHRNVVSVVDFGEAEGGLLYLSMDYVEGENLRDIIKRERPLDSQRVMQLMAQLCQGLAHAHGKGLVHRDFKTDNILVGKSDDGEVARIVDFGIAMLSETADSSERLTTHGVVVGTPAYMSPEQAAGDAVDHRSDLFSLGLVCYELLSGVLPFKGSAMGIMRSNLALDPPPISERVPGLVVDPGLEALAHELMAKNPDERPQDANEVLLRLERMWTGTARLASKSGISGSMSASSSASPSASRSGATPVSGVDAELAFQPTVSQPAMPAVARVTTTAQPIEQRRGWLVPGLILGLAVVVGVFLFARRSSDTRSAATHGSALAVGSRPAIPTIEPTEVVVPARSEGGAGTNHGPGEALDPGTADGDRSTTTDGETPAADRRAGQDLKKKRDRRSRHRSRHQSRRAQQREKKAAGRDPGDNDTVPARTEVTTKALTSRYSKVGAALESLRNARGDEAADQLRERYFAIPFTDALQNPELRAQADATLRKLQRDIARAAHE